jgi:hypothetical protein
MTHHISGFIGPTAHLQEQTKDLANAKVIPLAQGLAFLPLGNALYEEIWKINPHPMKWLSKKFSVPVAWIETDYFGGAGNQNAILWKDGKKRRYRDSIDAALDALGVVCEGDKDEFDTLGLGHHRTNESWLGIDE